MKTLSLVVAAFLLVSSALAQDDTKGSNSGTAPQNRGVTGWIGGTRDQKQGDQANNAEELREAANQPWMAEGADLQGPPRQFPPKKTVE